MTMTQYISPKECAFALMTFDDEEFVEFFVYAMKMKNAGINGKGGYEFPSDMRITRDDVISFDFCDKDNLVKPTVCMFVEWLKESVVDIVCSDEVDEYAWWKGEQI